MVTLMWCVKQKMMADLCERAHLSKLKARTWLQSGCPEGLGYCTDGEKSPEAAETCTSMFSILDYSSSKIKAFMYYWSLSCNINVLY